MEHGHEPALANIGNFGFEVFGGGRKARYQSSHFKLRCDAIGLHEKEILLLSVVGSETSVKALTAGLRASGKDQKRIEYSARVGNLSDRGLAKCPDGYRIYRSKLDYGLWHVLCLAKRDGFMPVMTEESVWQLLQGERFTTPLLREWIPWLYRRMKDREIIVELSQNGCQAGLLLADSEALDTLIGEGLRQEKLTIGGQKARSPRRTIPALDAAIQSLDEYMLAHGQLLGKQAERSLEPLHVPGRDILPELDLLRNPFAAQAHTIEATRKALCRQKSLLLVGEMGTGKSLMSMAAIHAHANATPYRALVFCPGQLVNKWEREIRETIPAAEVFQIESWKSLLHLDRNVKPMQPEWYVIARDRAKLGAKWQPAYVQRKADNGFLRCPNCGLRLVNEDREPLSVGRPGKNGQSGSGLWKHRSHCAWILTNHRGAKDGDQEHSDVLIKGCGSPLWQMTGEIWRYEPALFIKRHLRGFFSTWCLTKFMRKRARTRRRAMPQAHWQLLAKKS